MYSLYTYIYARPDRNPLVTRGDTTEGSEYNIAYVSDMAC